MKMEKNNTLVFSSGVPPKLSDLQAIVDLTKKEGFPAHSEVHITAGVDERDHDYHFKATITRATES